MAHTSCIKARMPLISVVIMTAILVGIHWVQEVHAAGFSNRYEFTGTTLPAGTSIVDIKVDGRQPRYPETFVRDMDGDTLPEFIAFPGEFRSGECRPLLIALSTVRGNDDIDSSDTRYITIQDANGSVASDSFCTDIETFDAVGDMNGDGFSEFALYSQGTHIIQGVQNLTGEIRLADHDGINSFVVENALLRRDLGDLDGDGLDELALTQFDPSIFDLGPEYILRGRAGERSISIVPGEDGTDELLATIVTGSENFGLLLPLGDVNGDTLDDLLIQQSDNLNLIYGEVGLQIDINVLASPDTPSIGSSCGFFSCRSLSGFDFDADGFDDLAVTLGSLRNSPSVILYGGSDGLPEGQELGDFDADRITLLTGVSRLSSGFVETFGDLNGDGVDDVYFSSGRDTVILFSTPGRRVAEIDLDSLDGSNGFRLELDQVQVSDTFRPFINGRTMIADVNGDGFDDYLDGRIAIEGLNDAPTGRAPLGVLVRQGPESADLFWRVLSDASEVDGFRISLGETLLAELPATSSSIRVGANTSSQAQDIRIATVDTSGIELGASVRRLQEYEPGFRLRAEVYGPNLVEIFWDAPADDYLVWRDGEVYQQVNGHSFLDTDVEPGVLHEYYVTQVLLSGGTPTADYLNSLEGWQRRTNVVVIGPPGTEEPVDIEDPVDVEAPADIEGSDSEESSEETLQRPDVPADLTSIIYSSTAAEIFWSRVSNVAIGRYDVYRNGEWVASVQGPSWFDDALDPGVDYRYSVVAVSTAGIGSDASATLTLRTDSSASSATVPATEPASDPSVLPTGLIGLIYSSSALELFWDRDSARSRNYIVSSQGIEIGRTDGTSFYVDGLNPDVDYEFTVVPVEPEFTDPAVGIARVVLSTR